jgi:hypothetical protein
MCRPRSDELSADDSELEAGLCADTHAHMCHCVLAEAESSALRILAAATSERVDAVASADTSYPLTRTLAFCAGR